MKNLINNGYEIDSEDFGIMSGLMMDNDGVIEAIEYARDGIISDAYPLEGNEEAIKQSACIFWETLQGKKKLILL